MRPFIRKLSEAVSSVRSALLKAAEPKFTDLQQTREYGSTFKSWPKSSAKDGIGHSIFKPTAKVAAAHGARKYSTQLELPPELSEKIYEHFLTLKAIGKPRIVMSESTLEKAAKSVIDFLENGATTNEKFAKFLEGLGNFSRDPENTAMIIGGLPIKGEKDTILAAYIVQILASVLNHKPFIDKIIKNCEAVDSEINHRALLPHCDQPLSRPHLSIIALTTLESGERKIGTLLFECDEIYKKLTTLTKEILHSVDFKCTSIKSGDDDWFKIFSFDENQSLKIDFDADTSDLTYKRKDCKFSHDEVRLAILELSNTIFYCASEELGGEVGQILYIKNHRALHGRKELDLNSQRLLLKQFFEPKTSIEHRDHTTKLSESRQPSLIIE